MSNPLRFFDKHGNACFIPTTDGPCQVLVDSKVYRNPKYDSMRGNSANGSNQGNTDHLAQIESATAQIKTDYETALPKLSTTNTSSPDVPYVPNSRAQYKPHT